MSVDPGFCPGGSWGFGMEGVSFFCSGGWVLSPGGIPPCWESPVPRKMYRYAPTPPARIRKSRSPVKSKALLERCVGKVCDATGIPVGDIAEIGCSAGVGDGWGSGCTGGSVKRLVGCDPINSVGAAAGGRDWSAILVGSEPVAVGCVWLRLPLTAVGAELRRKSAPPSWTAVAFIPETVALSLLRKTVCACRSIFARSEADCIRLLLSFSRHTSRIACNCPEGILRYSEMGAGCSCAIL